MKKKIIILLVAITVVIPAAAYFMGYIPLGEAAAEEGEETVELDSHGEPIPADGDINYLPLNPPFVVNFTHLGTLRYLQISLELMYPEQNVLDRVTNNMPAVRNALILILSDQPYEKLNSREGKLQIREEIMVAINDIIHASEKEISTGEVYITNFVMQ